MKKQDQWRLYSWVRARLKPDEVKMVMAKNPGLLQGTDPTHGIHLEAKLTILMDFLNPPPDF